MSPDLQKQSSVVPPVPRDGGDNNLSDSQEGDKSAKPDHEANVAKAKKELKEESELVSCFFFSPLMTVPSRGRGGAAASSRSLIGEQTGWRILGRTGLLLHVVKAAPSSR